MRRHRFMVHGMALVIALWAAQALAVQTLNAKGTIEVAFSPSGGATALVTDALRAAKREILVQAYSFTSAAIAKALGEAKARGVDVRAVLDKSNETGQYSGATYLAHHAIPVWIDDKHAIAHNKVMVIDGDTVITGSFNFTKAAEKHNAENVIVLRGNPELAAVYRQNWAAHQAHCVPYTGVHPAAGSPEKTEPATGGVIGNRKSHIYQFPGCPTYGRVSEANREVFATPAQAEAAGYRMAKNCPAR